MVRQCGNSCAIGLIAVGHFPKTGDIVTIFEKQAKESGSPITKFSGYRVILEGASRFLENVHIALTFVKIIRLGCHPISINVIVGVKKVECCW
jgi:hypothetical protein